MKFFKRKKDLCEIEADIMGFNENFANDLKKDKEDLIKGEITQKAYEKKQRAIHKILFD